MPEVTARLRRRIERDFPDPGSAPEIARMVAEASEDERIQAAIVLGARGDLDRLRDSADLTGIDWRDVLVGGGLADEDWRECLDRVLGPAT
jgi:hypothetical protein